MGSADDVEPYDGEEDFEDPNAFNLDQDEPVRIESCRDAAVYLAPCQSSL